MFNLPFIIPDNSTTPISYNYNTNTNTLTSKFRLKQAKFNKLDDLIKLIPIIN